MVRVKILSGPRAGQVNLGPMKPEDLYVLAEHGWRWTVDWKTVADHEALAWGKNDLMAKVISVLVRGGEVRFLDQVWRARTAGLAGAMTTAQLVEDYVFEAGFNVFAGEDDDGFFVIIYHSPERGYQS